MCGMKKTLHTALAAAVDLQPAAGAGAPEWVHLLPAGNMPARDGREAWRNDDPAGVVAATLAHAGGIDLPIDYDHQTDYAAIPQVGGRAEAGGWIKELQVRPDGVWGRVEWTATAAAKIAERAYRYLSPVFDFEPGSRKVIRLLRAALVNNPALTLTALSHQQQETDSMDETLKALLAALGLKPETDQATAIAHAQSLVTSKAALDAAAKKLGIAGEATETALASAIDGAKSSAAPDPAKYVPITALTEVQTALAAIQTERATEKAEQTVATAMAAGKITPGQKDWATDYAIKDAAGFAAYVAAAPKLLSGGGSLTVRPAAGQDGELGAEDRAICAQLGIKPEDFKAQRAAEKKEV